MKPMNTKYGIFTGSPGSRNIQNSTFAERATVKIGAGEPRKPLAGLKDQFGILSGYEWFTRASPPTKPGTKYVCRVCGPGWGLLSRQVRLAHAFRDAERLGIERCLSVITRRFLNRRVYRHRKKAQFYHEAPQWTYRREDDEG